MLQNDAARAPGVGFLERECSSTCPFRNLRLAVTKRIVVIQFQDLAVSCSVENCIPRKPKLEAATLDRGSISSHVSFLNVRSSVCYNGTGPRYMVDSNGFLCRIGSELHWGNVWRFYLEAMQCASGSAGKGRNVARSNAEQAVRLVVSVVPLRHQRASRKAVCSHQRKKADRYAATLMQVDWVHHLCRDCGAVEVQMWGWR
jgi:hypothetical protein